MSRRGTDVSAGRLTTATASTAVATNGTSASLSRRTHGSHSSLGFREVLAFANVGEGERIPKSMLIIARQMECTRVGSPDDVTEGHTQLFDVAGTAISVANVNGRHYAFDDRCTLRGCSLAKGTLYCTTVECPCHGSQFDVVTGSVLRGPALQPVHSWTVTVAGKDLLLGPR